MKKKITKELIVETALELMRDKADLQGLNLREVARTLGCAHTNLYNYFPSYSDLLWETHIAVLEIFMEMLEKKLEETNNAEQKLSYFFNSFVVMYVENKGWFRLAWQEYIDGDRPVRDVEVTVATNQSLNEHISKIWQELTGEKPDMEQTARVLHITHCYIIGEISNYLSGRGLIENEAELKAHVTHEAVQIFRLGLQH